MRQLTLVRRGRRGLPAGSSESDAGLTLVELAVAMLVASVLFIGVGSVFVGTMRAVRTVNTRTSTAADVRIATEAMSRTLRVAYVPQGEAAAITVASQNAVTFYALLNRTTGATAQPLPMKVSYSWSGNCLYQSQTPATPVTNPPATGPFMTWTTGTVTRCLLRTTTAPSFSYYDDGSSTTPLTFTAGSLTGTQLPTVQSVGFTVTAIDPKNPDVHGVSTQVQVTMVNLLS